MKTLSQNLRSGVMHLGDTPVSSPGPGQVLVRHAFSLISAGTEGSTVQAARSNLLEKARQRPEQVKQVLASVKTEGLAATYQKVMNKLDSPATLGYSSAGVVVAVGDNVRGIRVGDRVACGGQGAAHGEIGLVPENLCAPVPDGLDLKDAAFTTVGAIALQGVRQTDLRLGENCVVIGLGLVGQLTLRLLRRAGVHCLGVDISKTSVARASEHGFTALAREDSALEDSVLRMSGGYGTDAVIITAGASSLDPVELAGQLCRSKGKVVIVGAVPTGFSRMNYYNKELELRMSCSYGPGRYDTRYEDQSLDYPIGYVRWTENRNMRAFLDLAPDLALDELITHTFPFEKAIGAFDLIAEKNEFFLGIVLQYNTDKPLVAEPVLMVDRKPQPAGRPGIGFVGAGSFARKFLLPNAKPHGDFRGVVTAQGIETRHIAEKYGFAYAAGGADDIWNDDSIHCVYIATRHDSHAELVKAALSAKKHVFVEKPLCMSEEELEEIRGLHEQMGVHLMVGFNRRFSPHIEAAIKHAGSNAPRTIMYRINAGPVPPDSWFHDPAVGGGRIIGEVCHFLDLAMFLAGSMPETLAAQVVPDPNHHWDSLTVNLGFFNGSIASIDYFANGAPGLPKEYIEVSSAGRTAVIHDFKRTDLFGAKAVRVKAHGQDKGHAKEVATFLKAVEKGGDCPIPFPEIHASMQMTFDVLRSLQERRMIVYGRDPEE